MMQFKKTKQPPEQGRDSGRRQVQRGSPANPAFSYYASRQPEVSRERTQLRSDEPQARQKAGQSRRLIPRFLGPQLPFWLLLAVAAVCVGKVLLLSTNPKVIIVGKTSASANYLQSTDIYAAAAHKLLTSSITNRTKLTANLSGTAQSLQHQFPELQTASLAVPLVGSRPIVYVQLAAPALVLQSAHGGNYALNASGVVLARLQTLPADVPLLVDQSSDAPQPGKQFLPSSTVAFVQTMAFQLSAAKLPVSTYVLPVGSPYELDVRLNGKPYAIRCNLEADARTQSGAAIATLQQLGSTVPAAYIDVRVPDRAYYK